MNSKTASFYTLGCKLNFSETSTISRDLEEEGYAKVDFETGADIYVINTCSVTDQADKKCRNIVRKALKYNPHAFIIVIGCYAQLKPEELANVSGVDLVLGSKEKFKILDYLNDFKKNQSGNIHSCEISETNFYRSSFSIGDRTRSFLKVQDGCDYKCTYCTIPLARGKSRSGKIEDLISNAEYLVCNGIKEIVLTGVNIGDYGIYDPNSNERETNFFKLIKEFNKVKMLNRVRISSIEPNLLTDDIISFVSKSNMFVNHFHIPLQSGSDKILNLMKRRYMTSLYSSRIKKIKELMPDCCIGVDVIVGFPGESDEDFMQTFNFLSDLDISYLHVFSYSERDNTESIKLTNKVSKTIKSQRSKSLRVLSSKKKNIFYKKNLKIIRPVLFESKNNDGYIFGYTDNYVRVKALWSKNLIDKVVNCKLIDISNNEMVNVIPII